MRYLLLTVLAVFALNANAVTINQGTSSYLDGVFLDYGQYHRDTTTNLEWLDFTQLVTNDKINVTLQHSIVSAEAQFVPQGWRLATTAEVYDLFELFFPTYVGTDGKMKLDDYADPTAELIEARNSWMFAFGTSVTATSGTNLNTDAGDLFSLGMYVDDATNKVQYLGTSIMPSGDAQIDSYLYGPDNATIDLTRTLGYQDMGVFMVRDYTVVPIPAAIWLFGTGLLGLVAVARRKVQ